MIDVGIFYAAGVILLIILLLLWYISSVKEGLGHDILTGYWEANDDFLEKNNISKFAMAIGPEENSKRTVYLVVQDLDGKTLINGTNAMVLKSKWSNLSSTRGLKYNVALDTETSIIPQKLDMIYDISSGFISLYDKDTIYAELYKNNMLSDLDTDK